MSGSVQLERPPTRRRFDVDGYYRMAAAGLLPADDRVELIDGEIIDMSPIGSAHAGIVDRLARAFAAAFAAGALHLGVQRPLRLGTHDEPLPDLVLLRPRGDDYQTAHPGAADVLLLIEVAASSLGYDRTTKLPLYARHAIPEVWIVDLTGAAIEAYRDPRQGTYALREAHVTAAVQPLLIPSVTVDVGALFAA